MARVYYVSSYFWDRAMDSGIITDKAAIHWKTSPGVRGAGTRGQECAGGVLLCCQQCLKADWGCIAVLQLAHVHWQWYM